MADRQLPGRTFADRIAWARNMRTPLREFLNTETGSAVVLLAATVAALVWANVDPSSYEAVWGTRLSVHIGDHGISESLRWWVNSGLMTLFFFVVGLEARREYDMGELRDRRRLALPLAAGVAGMLVPVAIFLTVNAGSPSMRLGRGHVDDTAFALGMLALVGRRLPARLRTYLLTVSVVDDLVALVAIATVYSGTVTVTGLVVAVGLLGVVLLVRAAGVRLGLVYALLGTAAWVALNSSGVEPVVVGLAIGMLTFAYPAARTDLERASEVFRLFREQPTPERARSAQTGVAAALSPNELLQQRFHPWTGYVIVPLFALTNAGITISPDFLTHAYTSPITLGILFAYVCGKPIGILGVTWLVTRLSRGRLRPPVGWAAVAGGAAVAGVGFTVALVVAALAFTGEQLAEAKLGILSAALVASAGTRTVSRASSAVTRNARSDCPTTVARSPWPTVRPPRRCGWGTGHRTRRAPGPKAERLFDVYQGPRFTVLAFGPAAVDALQNLAWPTGGDELRRYTVHTGHGDDHGIVDTGGLVSSSYGITSDTLVLIRPDGYVGSIITADWTTAFAAAARTFASV
jgi:Na+/H+ antiporter NhaA